MAKLRLGLILDRSFHTQGRWVSTLTPPLIEGLLARFDVCWMENQADYEARLGDVDAVLSMEPGWAAPRLNFVRTPALADKLAALPSFIYYSDPHDNPWREDYFLNNRIGHVLAPYRAPTLHHFRRIPRERIVHLPWAIPDAWLENGLIRYRGQSRILCFGAGQHEAYAVRNWCRAFDFVHSAPHSGVENKVLEDRAYLPWLAGHDAAIAAGSDAEKYRLTVPKYFEIAAAGTLLFAQQTDDLAALGFVHLENCIVFNRDNFERLAQEYLAHPYDYQDIRMAGRELIRARHCLSQRLDQIEQLLDEGTAQPRRSSAVVSATLPSAPDTGNAQDNKLPNILFIVDAPRWAHDQKTDNLIKTLSAHYRITKRFQDQVSAAEIDAADLVVIYYWLQFKQMPGLLEALARNQRKLLLGVCSQYEMSNEFHAPGLAALRTARAVFVNNLIQYHELATQLDVPLYYTPNGVDCGFYTPAAQPGRGPKLRVGWAGSLTNQGSKRGYHDYIVPALAGLDGVELVTAAREQNWRGAAEMREFYRSLDVYICASSEEGTPNPCLEAAACGVPLLTTRVGNMPELIQHGVNGLFIERDVQDIRAKLMLLRDNESLRLRMGHELLATIREWDWQHLSAHYRQMFDAMLRLNATDAGSGGNVARFISPEDLYLASADRMDRVLDNIEQLAPLQACRIVTYASVIGGMSGLNYLLRIAPARVIWFDINVSALGYARLIVELIGISDTPADFIARVFGRDVSAFCGAHGYADLLCDNQAEYLRSPVEAALVTDTLARLSPEARDCYATTLQPFHSGLVLDGVRNCRRLLPCWPIDQRVPVGGGEATGYDEFGQRVPNTNSFFYGHGWLADRESFQRVQHVLAQAVVTYVSFDLLNGDLRAFADAATDRVLHVSNIDDWFPEAWQRSLDRWVLDTAIRQGHLTLISSHNGIGMPNFQPHDYAYAGIAPHVYGRVVEVTHKLPWGFDEFERDNVLVDDYLQGSHPANTTILHILVGEGLDKSVLVAACQKALQQSDRVLVLEHNRDSADWPDEQKPRFLAADELLQLIALATGEMAVSVTDMLCLAGEHDAARNVLVVLDRMNRTALGKHADSDVQDADYVNTQRHNAKISVILPTYNRAELLALTLTGFSNQTLHKDEFEVVVVDDGSIPPVSATIEAFAERLNIIYHYQDNAGLAAARNACIERATAPLLALHDDDDLPGPDYLQRCLDFHAQHPDEADILLAKVTPNSDLQNTPMLAWMFDGNNGIIGFPDPNQVHDYWWFFGGTSSCKRSLFRYGLYDPDYRFGFEDTELAIRLNTKVFLRVHYDPDTVSFLTRAPDFAWMFKRSYREGRSHRRLFDRYGKDVLVGLGADALQSAEIANDISAWLPEVIARIRALETHRDITQNAQLRDELFGLYLVCRRYARARGFDDFTHARDEGQGLAALEDALRGPAGVSTGPAREVAGKLPRKQSAKKTKTEADPAGGCPAVTRADTSTLIWLRPDSVSDNILSMSMLPAIREHYPTASITVVCQEHCMELYQACPLVDDIITFNRQQAADDKGYLDSLVARLQAKNADILLNSVYSRDLLTDFLAISSNVRHCIALKGDLRNISDKIRERHNSLYTKVILSPAANKSELERHSDFLAGLGVARKRLSPTVWISPEDDQFAGQLFITNSLTPEKTIVLCAGFQHDDTGYENYGTALASLCSENGFNVVALGNKEDFAISEKNLQKIGARTLNLCGSTTLRQSAAIISHCLLAVGGENEFMHMACAVDVPNVVLQGGGNSGRFMPYSPLTTIACLPLECYGCDWQCRHEHKHCITDLAPEVLTEAINLTLAGPADQYRVVTQDQSHWAGQPGFPAWKSCDGFFGESHSQAVANVLSIYSSPDNSHSGVRVSVIIPCYNYAHYLPDAVNSVLAQSFTGHEIIIVNDGSTDNSLQVAESLIAGNPAARIRLINQPNSGRPAIARNAGVRIARGEYILCLDADDTIDPEFLSSCVALLDNEPSVSIAYTDQIYFNENGEQSVLVGEYSLERLMKNNFMSYCSLYRRKAYDAVGGYAEDIGYEDWDFWIGCGEQGHYGRRVPGLLFNYRKHVDGQFARDIMHDEQIRAEIRRRHPGAGDTKTPSTEQEARVFDQKFKRPIKKDLRVVALISAHNEGDVIQHVIGDLVAQGVEVYLIDHCSSDDTVEQASKWLGKGLLHIEKFPQDSGFPDSNLEMFNWGHILKRKEELAGEIDADWFIHHDADEFRESPWPDLTLRQAIQVVDALGYSAIDFALFNFRPVDNRFIPGSDVRLALTGYEPGEAFNLLQIKAWKNVPGVQVLPNGGHNIMVPGRRVFPIKFILRHYPVRSQQHGMRKVIRERKARFPEEELRKGWHVQYDHVQDARHDFLHDPATLTAYNADAIRARLLSADAFKIIGQLSDEDSPSAGMPPDSDTDALLHDGEAHFSAGRVSESIDCFLRVLRHNPRSIDAINNLGVIAHNLGNSADAMALFREALAIDPDNVQARTNLGDCLMQEAEQRGADFATLAQKGEDCFNAGELAEARACFEAVLRRDPLHAVTLNNLGVWCYAQGDLPGAQEWWQRALQAQPDFQEVIENIKRSAHGGHAVAQVAGGA